MALIEKLEAIGDAIRLKTGKTERFTLDQMVTEILSISGGEVAKTYTVRFFNYDGTLLETVEKVAEGANVAYSGDNPVRPNTSAAEDWVYTGWNPEPVNIIGDMDCYAQFRNTISVARKFIDRTISGEYENDQATSVRAYAFYNANKVTGLNLPNVTTVGENAFYSAFGGAVVVLPNVKVCPNFGYANVKVADFHSLESIGAAMLDRCYPSALILRNPNMVCTLGGTLAWSGGPTYIYVPAALLDDYKAATNWSNYAAKLRAIEDYTVDGTITGALDASKI